MHTKGNMFAAVLGAAVKEWFLILLLFISASFSYLLTKFARSNKLQLPCLMCSRLDHVLGKQKNGFYWDLICDRHKFTLSSLVLCRHHNKLVNVHQLCENCLFSFATVDKSNAQTYRLLVGKLGHEDRVLGDSGTGKRCSCCNEQWITRYKQDEITDVLCREITTEERSIDPLPHVEYEKVRMVSDTESEALISDDECVTEHGKENLASEDQEKDLRIGHDVEDVNQQHAKEETDSAATHDLISFSDVPLPSSNVTQSYVDESGDKLNILGAELEKVATTSSKMTQLPLNSTQANGKQSDFKSGKCDLGFPIPSTLELGDAYKLAVLSRGRQLSGKFLEQKLFKDSTRISEDLKVLLSQLSVTRGIEPLYDISPRVSGNIDEVRTYDASNSFGLQMLQKRISLERNESNISLDDSIVSEIEGESEVDKLKRQVEHDRKLMSALYKELEEERNASAVAANQTMAMITRLQEEKAALHLEALQLIRLMEEQAEYDGEDLQKANDLLAEKERDIEVLEMELKGYREKMGFLTKITSTVDENSEFIEARLKQIDSSNIQPNVSIRGLEIEGESINLETSLQECENQPSFLPEALRKLEKKFQLFSSNNENLLAKENQQSCPGSGELMHVQLVRWDSESDVLRKQFPVLSCRLEALEAECSFLENSIKSLSKGGEGLKFVQEIACQLQELHALSFKRRN